MSTLEMDPIFSEALREILVTRIASTPRARRRWRWQLGTGVFLGLSLVASGVALATSVFSPPGAPVNSLLGNIVTATHTGTATVELGAPPAASTDLSLALTCLTPGTFYFPNGSSESCGTDDMSRPALYRTASEVVPLGSGVDSVTITTREDQSWALQATYVNQVITPWGVNENGQTFGAENQSGTPDLVAVVIDQGAVHGYVEESELICASGGDVTSPAKALKWAKESQSRNISIPVYNSNGTTVIGTFVTGDAAGSNAETVPLSSLSLGC